MDGCDGFDGVDSVDCGGLDGFDGPGHDAIDTIDLLNGAEHASGAGASQVPTAPGGVGISDDGDMVVVHVMNHGDAPLFEVFSAAANDVGLMRVASILVGQKALEVQRSFSILPTSAWSGAAKGKMPRGYVDGACGSTTMFRQYFQIPKREWGFFSTPVYDKEASVYLDVSGMSWHYRDFGDYESQLIVRVVPMTQLDARSKCWCIKPAPVSAHRKAAHKVGKAVHTRLGCYRPSARAVEARGGIVSAPAVVAAPAPRREPRRAVAAVLGGVDLLTALRQSPQFGVMHTLTAGIPPQSTESHAHATAEGVEMVNLRLALPRR